MLKKCDTVNLQTVIDLAGEDKIKSLEIKQVDGDFMIDYSERSNETKLSSMETRSRVVKYLEQFRDVLSNNMVKKFSLTYDPDQQKVLINKGYADAPVGTEEAPTSFSAQAKSLLKMACHLNLDEIEVNLFHRKKQGGKNKYSQASLGSTLRSIIEDIG